MTFGRYSLSVAAGSSVLALKQQLQLQCDVPVERQRLLHKGRDMDNQAKLSAYSTGSEIVLFLVVKFPSPSTWQSTSVAPDGSAPCVVLRGTLSHKQQQYRFSAAINLSCRHDYHPCARD